MPAVPAQVLSSVPKPPRQRIAIIGSGIAGLSAAWLLSQDHDVTLYERANAPGMGIFQVSIRNDRVDMAIDIPLRVFTPAYYPSLLTLYRAAGVATETTNHAAAYADGHNGIFFHYGNWRMAGHSVAWPKYPNVRLLRAHLQFFRVLQRSRHDTNLAQQSFGDFLHDRGIFNEYAQRIMLPALATVCTCDYDDVLAYPADMLVHYLTCGVMKDGLLRAQGGVNDVVSHLLDSSVTVRTRAAVEKIVEHDDQVWVHLGEQSEGFDRVVIATQPHHAAQLLMASPSDAERCQLLSAIPITESRMQVHTDASLLPRSRLGLSPVSYFLPGQESRPEATVDLTKAMSSLAGCDPVLQVWNPLREAAPDSVLADVSFTRPLVTLASRQAVHSLRQQDASQRVLLTGSYLCDGIPLLDGAVESSLRVARLIGSSRAW
ncbi:MAG: FAD-dependent oxidoreductase [Bacterioplanes sp.]|nr:FAD-dependent oxidoreductase [Bacterioplanes sp.]